MDLLSVQVLVQQHGGKVTGPRPFAGLACGKSETGLCAGRSLAVPARPRALHPDPAPCCSISALAIDTPQPAPPPPTPTPPTERRRPENAVFQAQAFSLRLRPQPLDDPPDQRSQVQRLQMQLQGPVVRPGNAGRV